MVLQVVATDSFVIVVCKAFVTGGSTRLYQHRTEVAQVAAAPPGCCKHTSCSQSVCCVSQPSIQSMRKIWRDRPVHQERRRGLWEGKHTGARPLSACLCEEEEQHLQSPLNLTSSRLPMYMFLPCQKAASMRSACGKWSQGLSILHTWIPLITSLHPPQTAQHLGDVIIQVCGEITEKPSVVSLGDA